PPGHRQSNRMARALRVGSEPRLNRDVAGDFVGGDIRTQTDEQDRRQHDTLATQETLQDIPHNGVSTEYTGAAKRSSSPFRFAWRGRDMKLTRNRVIGVAVIAL